MELPPILVDFITEGQAILFLGAGASYGAKHPSGNRIPSGEVLKDLLSDQFLGGEFKDRALAQVAELAISESDLFTVYCAPKTGHENSDS